MKVFLSFALLAISVQLSVAIFGTNIKNTRFEKYRLNKEPPLNDAVQFADVVYQNWIEQRLDHFNPQNNATWSMRYLENNDNLVEGGPIFIYVGGEWTVSAGWLRTGHMYDMAKNLSGIMFYTEHRYYGDSRPVENLEIENMAFLNVDQALADLAHFIVHIKATIPEVRNSGVILVGASYSATMVTWFLQKYPHLANGAWSSSAPLEAQVDFIEYKEVVSEALETIGGSNCSSRIRAAFEELEQLVAEGNSSIINKVFHLCHPLNLDDDLDVWSFFSDMAGPFSGLVQYHRTGDIEYECEYMETRKGPTAMEALAQWFWGIEDWEGIPETYCYDHRYEVYLIYYNGTSWDSLAAYYEFRQWFYQTCAEYGWYQSSGSDNILFGSSFPADLTIQLCHDLYNEIFDADSIQRNVERTNIMYGGFNPGPIRNLYSTHGQFDPWRPMGLQVDLNEHSPTTILPGETHCSDLYSMHESDSPEMRASKERVFELVQQWLGL